MTKVKRNKLQDYDPRLLPSYGVPEAAHYLGIPVTTLRAWAFGQKYKTNRGEGAFKPVIIIPDKNIRLLSFINLVEIHILGAIRRKHKIPLPKVRQALLFIENHFSIKNPLANVKFETDGIDLFIEKSGLINITKKGQMGIRSLLKAHLKRIERDTKGIPIKLYPFTRKHEPEGPKSVVIDPFVSFGRPILSGTGIATSIIFERFKAGEDPDELADDYGRDRNDIMEAIRCESEAA